MFKVSKTDENGMPLEVKIDYRASFPPLVVVDNEGNTIYQKRLTEKGWIIELKQNKDELWKKRMS